MHTAGNSQISDGAAAVLGMTAGTAAAALGLTPCARVVDTRLQADPCFMLTGPIDATQRLLERTAQPSATSTCPRSTPSPRWCWPGSAGAGADLDRTTPTAAPSPSATLGGTGAFLVTKAVHELQRTDGSTALVSMCCGGGLGTGTILERL